MFVIEDLFIGFSLAVFEQIVFFGIGGECFAGFEVGEVALYVS